MTSAAVRTPPSVRYCAVFFALASCATGSPSGRPTTTAAAAATPAATDAPHETPEQIVARLLAPEATAPLTPQTIEVDANLHLVGHGTAAATVTRDGEQMQVVLPIGGREPVHCTVLADSIDLSNSARHVYENVRHENPDTEIHGIDAGFVGDTPYVDVQALYVVGPANQRALGHLKIRAFNVHERGVVCLHDEPGFSATFDRATRPMMEVAPVAPRPDRYLVTMDGRTCGWMTSRTTTEGTGHLELSITSFLLPRSEQEMVASDHADIERYTRAGEVSDIQLIRSDDSAVSTYHVTRAAATRRYHVEGRHLGREIAGDFTATTPLINGVFAMQRAWRTLTGPRPPATVEVVAYESDNPLVASTQTFRMERVVDARRAWLVQHVGDVDGRVLVGTEGIPDEMSVAVAGHAIVYRRVTE